MDSRSKIVKLEIGCQTRPLLQSRLCLFLDVSIKEVHPSFNLPLEMGQSKSEHTTFLGKSVTGSTDTNDILGLCRLTVETNTFLKNTRTFVSGASIVHMYTIKGCREEIFPLSNCTKLS